MECKSIGCEMPAIEDEDFCFGCREIAAINLANRLGAAEKLSDKYPQYYKPVGDLEEIDVYAVHHLFNIQDPSGALQHSSKKILLSGVRTGNKSKYKDIKEARDTLTRWLQLNPEKENIA